MTSIDIQMDGDNCWPDLKDREVMSGELTGVALLPDASVVNTLTGEHKRVPSLTLRVEIDGGVVLAQVKVDMVNMIMAAVKGRLELLASQKEGS